MLNSEDLIQGIAESLQQHLKTYWVPYMEVKVNVLCMVVHYAGGVHSTNYLNHKQLVHYTFQRCKDSAIPCTTSGTFEL